MPERLENFSLPPKSIWPCSYIVRKCLKQHLRSTSKVTEAILEICYRYFSVWTWEDPGEVSGKLPHPAHTRSQAETSCLAAQYFSCLEWKSQSVTEHTETDKDNAQVRAKNICVKAQMHMNFTELKGAWSSLDSALLMKAVSKKYRGKELNGPKKRFTCKNWRINSFS